MESLVIQNESGTDISSAFTIYHSKDAYGNIMSVYLDNAKNVDASINTIEGGNQSTLNYLAKSFYYRWCRL